MASLENEVNPSEIPGKSASYRKYLAKALVYKVRAHCDSNFCNDFLLNSSSSIPLASLQIHCYNPQRLR